jgi:hypothetical protein
MIIKVKISYTLVVLAYTLILGCALIILLSPWLTGVKLLILPIVLYAGNLHVERNAWLRSKKSIVALEPGEAGLHVRFGVEPGKPVPCRVIEQYVSTNFIAARLAESLGDQKHNLFIIRPMCSHNDFRVLKRFLLSRAAMTAN